MVPDWIYEIMVSDLIYEHVAIENDLWFVSTWYLVWFMNIYQLEMIEKGHFILFSSFI